MGIVNLTTDSFYPASRTLMHTAAIKKCIDLWNQGADILDLGAESSRPGASPLGMGVEISRLLPVIMALKHSVPSAILAVDTWHATTAQTVLEQGAHIINDISACRFDPGLVDVLAQYKPGYILVHNPGSFGMLPSKSKSPDIIADLEKFFTDVLTKLVKAGLPEDRVILDPGIGFAKSHADNLTILQNIAALETLGRPLLVGLSHKRLFEGLLGLDVAERSTVTQVATALLWERGVVWHRVHDVGKALEVLTLASYFGQHRLRSC
ncbi:MAG: dihydropteroate synthase [Desulfovibrionaceae bacterium]|nr:dihydropteroate synthase [Desulfovibrionaceae bacterium]